MAAELPNVYSGYGFSLRGEKNRFVLPPSFRNTIFEASETRTLCLVQHEEWDCLTGFGLNHSAELLAQFNREQEAADRNGRDFNASLRRMQLFSFEQIPFDSSGRFVMPDFLVAGAGLGDSLFAIGAGDSFTLWAPEKLYAMGPQFAPMQAACRSFEAEARAKGKMK